MKMSVMRNQNSRLYLRDAIMQSLGRDKVFTYLVSNLERGNELIFFGGVVRDFVHYKKFLPRDIDIVLIGSNKEFYNMLAQDPSLSGRVCTNSYGGYKITGDKCIVDLWRLEDTWAFKNDLVELGVKNLFDTVFLNIDMYAYNFTKQRYLGHCDRRRLPEEIDVVLRQNPNLILNYLRALVLAEKYKIKLSRKLTSEIAVGYENDALFIEKMLVEQKRHYKKENAFFTRSKLVKIVDSFER